MITLLSLRIQLIQAAKDLDLVNDIIDNAVLSDEDPAYRSSYLLSYLYFLIQESSQDKNLAIHLFYKTILPYLELLADWVVSGKLESSSEFMVL